MSFKSGQNLFAQGDTGDAAYVLINGEVDVIVDTPKGELAVAKLSGNEIIGEIAILCDVPRTATIRAAVDIEALKIEKDHFLRMLQEFPEMAVEVMRELADRLSQTTAELSEARNQLSD